LIIPLSDIAIIGLNAFPVNEKKLAVWDVVG
jgi:hypothetical protein